MTCLLDCFAQLALMRSARPDYPPWDYLASLSDKIAQHFYIFVVYCGFFVSAETADFFSGK